MTMNWNKLKEVVSWGHYIHWAQLNADRWICADDHSSAESVATSFQFFASMYVAIEGWKNLKLDDPKIEHIIEKNNEGIKLLRRARNAVYHFQKEMYGEKMTAFAIEFGRDSWVMDLYYEFIRFIAEYPSKVYPFDERQEEFVFKYYEMLGWNPEYKQT